MNNNTLKLPHELILEILLRLPVRSLLRFKCVCKSWLSLISDPKFANSHFDLAAAPSHRLLFRATDDGFIQSIDTEASLHDDSAVVKLRIPPPLPPKYGYNRPCSPNDAVLLGSCRGLVLVYYRFIDHLILWNPSTGAYNRLPWTWGYPMIAKEFNYGLAYEASTDDYVLILMPSQFDYGWEPRFFLHYLKINSWKRSKDVIKFDYYSIGIHSWVGSLFNGALHWLVTCRSKENAVIVAFDLEEKTSSKILLPPPIDVEYNTYELYDLTVVGGCLSVCSSVQGQGRYEIWMMKEYKVESSWTKYLVISKYHIPYNPITPIYITKNGTILGSNYSRRLERLNDKGEFLEDLSYVGNFIPQTHMYIESLLSPMIVNGETSNEDQ